MDDRLQRPMRKLVRERNGIRVLVGLLRYRRQAAAADSVRLRSALCLLGLAHDVQIAQVLEKMRITTTLSDTVRAGPVVNRRVSLSFLPFSFSVFFRTYLSHLRLVYRVPAVFQLAP